MIILNNNSKVYVVALAFYKTGGLELLHQLVYELRQEGINAKIVYYNLKKQNNINKEFRKYVTSYLAINQIEDDENNILIVPETRIQALEQYREIKKIIWWLSVDNYIPTTSLKNHIHKFGVLRTLKHYFFYHDKYCDWNLKKVADFHMVQSNYAREYLHNRGITKIEELSDYINDMFFQNNVKSKKKDCVLYNPAKGYEYTKRIIEHCPELNWVALCGMTNEEVKHALEEGKVYIDFGNHPGKDRFPREAAISGCCIITGKCGAAGNDKDIPIASEFKFQDINENIELICRKVRECIFNYDVEIKKFEDYREVIKAEKDKFKMDIHRIFVKGIE